MSNRIEVEYKNGLDFDSLQGANAGVISNDVEEQLAVLEDGYQKGLAALTAEAEQDPAKAVVLKEYKRIYSSGIALIRKGAKDGLIDADTIEASPQYQDAKSAIQKALHKGQLGVSDEEIWEGVKEGVSIGGKVVSCVMPFIPMLFG